MSQPPTDQTATDDSATSESLDSATFERVDWEQLDQRRRLITAERLVFAFGLVLWAAIWAFHQSADRTYLVGQWIVDPEDWLLLLSWVVIGAYGVIPLIKRRNQSRRLLAKLRGSWEATVSLVVLVVVVLLGFRSATSNLTPELTLNAYHPPVGFTAPKFSAGDCAGTMSGEPPNVQCHGVWDNPLGTHRLGMDMVDLLMIGAQPSLYIIFVTIGLAIPLAITVGALAGYHGGFLDKVLMSYVDVQLTLPAMLIYLVAFMFVENSMLVFLLAFGLLSWGGIARIVRSETLKRREEGYVLSARAIGAPSPYIIRRHIFPNVLNSILPATFHLMAIMILTEAGLAFLGFTPINWTWGETIARGVQHHPPLKVWWTSTLPALVLGLTVVSCKLAGDHLRDVFDPRGDSQP